MGLRPHCRPSGVATVRIELWDWAAGLGRGPYPGDSPDDQSDVDLQGDRTLELQVDLAKCLRREPGAITGLPGPADCGAPLVSESNAEDEASKLSFHIRLSKSPPTAEAGGPYTTDEGQNVKLNGTGSSDPDNDMVSQT